MATMQKIYGIHDQVILILIFYLCVQCNGYKRRVTITPPYCIVYLFIYLFSAF